MGLCKCPKRKVTNQFCYEHRVNVCEHCVVINHPKCVVQSYLLWLQDSDYSPQCTLCKRDLADDECARLTCYHVFHWDCLDQYVRDLPETTAPAGYKCPSCKDSILPKQNSASPVADALREKLATVNWGRIGLCLPLSSEEVVKTSKKTSPKNSSMINGIGDLPTGSHPDVVVRMEDSVHIRPENSAQVPRRNPYGGGGEKVLLLDEDESKYRRQAYRRFLGLNFWFKLLQNHLNVSRRGPKGTCKLICVIVVIFLIICLIFSVLGNFVTSDDPAFDVHNNPNIRISNEE